MSQGNVAREPALRWVLGDTEVNDSPTIVAEDDQGVEEPKRRRCNDKHFERDNVGHVVLQK